MIFTTHVNVNHPRCNYRQKLEQKCVGSVGKEPFQLGQDVLNTFGLWKVRAGMYICPSCVGCKLAGFHRRLVIRNMGRLHFSDVQHRAPSFRGRHLSLSRIPSTDRSVSPDPPLPLYVGTV